MLSSSTVHNHCSSTHLSELSIVGRATGCPQRRAQGADAPRYRLLVMLCIDLYFNTYSDNSSVQSCRLSSYTDYYRSM